MGYSVPIVVFLGLSVLEFGPMYVTDRRQTNVKPTDVRQKHRLMPLPYVVGGIIKYGVFEQASHTEQVTYVMSQKQDTLFLSMTSANVDQFSKFFHFRTQR